MNKIGYWLSDEFGLPCFEYTGNIPYSQKLDCRRNVKLSCDPWFLLGNYQFTLFTHVSGEYELITGQRSWARMNQGACRNSGENEAKITIDGKEQILTGMHSLSTDAEKCRRVFGCGFAYYQYHCNGAEVTRRLSVKPSVTVRGGSSAFLLEVKIRNNTDKKISCQYVESVGCRYEEIQFQTLPDSCKKVKYQNTFFSLPNKKINGIKINALNKDSLTDRTTMSRYEYFPPFLFIQDNCNNFALTGDDQHLSAESNFTLQSSEEKQLSIIIGYSFDNGNSNCTSIINELSNYNAIIKMCSAYAAQWEKIIPRLDNEQDKNLRREMRWHAYNLEAMATYSEYYDETKIPQGTIYDYDWGVQASARDNFQHALPLVYYNSALAKSVLRYMLKRTTSFGEIRLIEVGSGYADNERYFTSDQQLYFFMLLSEYLRVTKEYRFLAEKITPYPVKNQNEMTVLAFAEQCFRFLRDTIGTGAHGLVKLMNSDWNDAVYYIEKVPYNNIMLEGESHMNTAMAISVFDKFISILRAAIHDDACVQYSGRINTLADVISIYRSNLLTAFLKDMDGRRFPKRMYFNGKAYGENNMFLEPQGFTLQIKELTVHQKTQLYHEMQNRVYQGEKIGAREQEHPEFEDANFDKGSRENGGFWWALNGPVIIGVANFDITEAKRLLKKMTLQNLSEQFPDYWSSYWSAADNLESSLIPGEGLPDQSFTYASIPVYCAHPHAWLLYCYFILNEK